MTDSISQTRDEVREHVQARWPTLSAADLDGFAGDASGLAKVLAERLGISPEQAGQDLEALANEIGRSMDEVVADLSEGTKGAWRASQEKVREVVDRGTQRVKDAWEGSRDQLDKLCQGASDMMRDRPLTTIGIAVGVGAAVALVLRGRRN